MRATSWCCGLLVVLLALGTVHTMEHQQLRRSGSTTDSTPSSPRSPRSPRPLTESFSGSNPYGTDDQYGVADDEEQQEDVDPAAEAPIICTPADKIETPHRPSPPQSLPLTGWADETTRATLQLLHLHVATQLFGRGFFPAEVMKELRARAPALIELDLGAGLPKDTFSEIRAQAVGKLLANAEVIKVLTPWFKAQTGTALGKGFWGSTILLKLGPVTRLVWKQFKDPQDIFARMDKKALLPMRFIVNVEIYHLPDNSASGYIMLAAAEDPAPWTWLQQWFRFAMEGAMHRDIKPDNLAGGERPQWALERADSLKRTAAFIECNRDRVPLPEKQLADKELIDLDNIIIQLGAKGSLFPTHKGWYNNGRSDEFRNIFLLTHATHRFLVVSGGRGIVFVLTKPYVEPQIIVDELCPSREAQVTSAAAAPGASAKVFDRVIRKKVLLVKIVCTGVRWPSLEMRDQVDASQELFEKLVAAKKITGRAQFKTKLKLEGKKNPTVATAVTVGGGGSATPSSLSAATH